VQARIYLNRQSQIANRKSNPPPPRLRATAYAIV